MAPRLRFLVVAFTLAGCAVGPDFKRPAPPEVKEYASAPLPASTGSTDAAFGRSQRFTKGAPVNAKWYNQALDQAPVVTATGAHYIRAHSTARILDDVRCQYGGFRYSPDGEWLATASPQGSVRVWSAASTSEPKS